MGVGKFDRKLPLPDHGDVAIKGPFDPQDRASTRPGSCS